MAETTPSIGDNWKLSAQCRDVVDPEIFAGKTPEDEAAAKTLCAECSVIKKCDASAEKLGKTIRDGWIFAGLTEAERQAHS